jgi:phosphonate metabolism protein PhnN/1,5-bisphosphokinase (PRPP-forming)
VAASASSDPEPPGGAGAAAAVAGRVVLVVGPSGVGKDTVLQRVRERLAGDDRFFFPRRIVTRAADSTEDHASLSAEAFDELAARGGFALHWHAHGHRYGIPAEADAAARAGRIVVFNASRLIVPVARRRYTAAAVVLIDAPVAIRTARLAARDREPPEEVAARLGRVVTGFTAADADLAIDNSGALEEAVAPFVHWLGALATAGVSGRAKG